MALSRPTQILALVCGGFALLIVGLLIGREWARSPQAEPEVELSAGPTQPPPAVNQPDHVRQSLQPGKTYVTHTKGTLHVRGEDRSWGFGRVVTINYAFEAQIDREIESNDGHTVVELRHFRDVRSIKVDTVLEDARLELGPARELLLAGLRPLLSGKPELRIGVEIAVRLADGLSLKPVLAALRWAGVSPEQIAGLDERTAKAFLWVDSLTGKKVRLTYVDGKGVQKIEPVVGEFSEDEKSYLQAGVLLSDTLILPNAEIKVGSRWSVPGTALGGFIADPAFRGQTSGEVLFEREPDEVVLGKTCRKIATKSARLTLDSSTPKEGRLGTFEPSGVMFFSPDDQIIIEARFRGTAKFEKYSKNHLLFESRMRRLPELEVSYTCRVADTVKAGGP